MLKHIFKVINDDTNKFIDGFYLTYGPGFFLLYAGVLLLIGLSSLPVGLHDVTIPGGISRYFWFISSGVFLVIYLDLRRGKP